MKFSKLEEKPKRFLLRWIKTLFFLITMFISLLLFSAPIFLAILDAVLPSALLTASFSSSTLSLTTLSSYLNNYDYRYSLVDIPLVSIVRSAIILCVYGCCDGPKLSRGPYLGTATACSVSSLVFVSVKASYVFSSNKRIDIDGGPSDRAVEVALFVCSLAMAMAHVGAAYRISCRERRKLLVYKIDIEAVSGKNGFPRYQKIIQKQLDKFNS